MPLLSIVTTCKGRLEHLKQTLSGRLAVPDSECIVVDYDCPQGAGDWVAQHQPSARVVHVRDRPVFNLAEARNLGARAAVAPWLLFVDADIVIGDGLIEALRPLLAAGRFYVPEPRPPEAWGTLVVARSDFEAIGGYDEVFEGWGGEDDDVLWRLHRLGRQLSRFPGQMLRPLQHDEADRTAYHDVRDRDASQAVNALYLTAKQDLIRLGIPVDAALRRRLYDDLRARLLAAATARDPTKISVGFRHASVGIWQIEASLSYRLTAARPAA